MTMPPTYPVRKQLVPLLVLLLAFTLQAVYLVELRRALPGSFQDTPFCGVDAQAHLNRAVGFLDRSVPGEQPFQFIPLYPFYLVLLKISLGDSILLPVYIQLLLQLPGIAALYAIGRLIFSPLTGALAALGLATYSYYHYYLPCYDQTLLTTPFLTLAVYFLLKHHRRGRTGWLIATGLALGLAAISRPTLLALFPAILLWFLWLEHPLRRVGWQMVLLLLPFMLMVAPVTWHNYRVSGRFILISDNVGVNLFTGNNPDAQGLDSLAHAQSQPAVLRYIEINEYVKGGQTTLPAEVWRYIREQPGDWFNLTLKKVWLWLAESDERLVSPYFPRAIDPSLLAWLPLEWRALAVTALLGILLASPVCLQRCGSLAMNQNQARDTGTRGSPFRKSASSLRSFRQCPACQRLVLVWLMYGALSTATAIFFVQLRFRLPFVPFALLSAASLLAAAGRWRTEQPNRYWMALIILLLLYPVAPGLAVFILIYAGLGETAWDKVQRPTGHQSRPAALIFRLLLIGLYLLGVGWWLHAEALASDVAQPIDHYLGPPLAGAGILGQSFEMDCDGLHQIELTLGVLGPVHDQPVIFSLATDPSDRSPIYTETFDGADVSDFQRRSFRFSPITGSAGHTFFFFLASPGSTAQNAITARGYTDTPIDQYPSGQAWAGQPGALQPLQADFAFTAYCDMSLWQKLKRVVGE